MKSTLIFVAVALIGCELTQQGDNAISSSTALNTSSSIDPSSSFNENKSSSLSSSHEQSSSSTDPQVFGATLDSLAKLSVTCVDEINSYRATENLPPLERWVEAEICTHQSSKADSETGNAHGSFGDCNEWAQNECPGWNSLEAIVPNCLKMMWDEKLLGPNVEFSKNGHYLNMSSQTYTKVACGFAKKADGKVWAIQNFK